MTGRYVLAPGAEADIRGIARYSLEHWGERKARAYLAAIDTATAAVAQGRGAFARMDDVVPGLRVAASGRHRIFCLSRTDRPALVLAVLHERMDIVARLAARLPADPDISADRGSGSSP